MICEKILTIVCDKPDVISAIATGVLSTSRRYFQLNEVLDYTGQHFDDSLSKMLFDELELHRIKYNLGAN